MDDSTKSEGQDGRTGGQGDGELDLPKSLTREGHVVWFHEYKKYLGYAWDEPDLLRRGWVSITPAVTINNQQLAYGLIKRLSFGIGRSRKPPRFSEWRMQVSPQINAIILREEKAAAQFRLRRANCALNWLVLKTAPHRVPLDVNLEERPILISRSGNK
ncbi:hypothetical protein DBB29_09480 [Pandoraea cepalis]|uniref:Uncharacterized protein n=1 Tax=Pandoraea cepalis TaxID=2508294 RepID=A0AAW7MMI3_9BURK|nr:hypothetical protein [Pandoraea cepalis]MDN4573803.1 hypothetical protein [Pandoraea cepalis]MDN4578345.1 hypothetical protein [Pandoraea cepalis]